jgi:hypothetical protein
MRTLAILHAFALALLSTMDPAGSAHAQALADVCQPVEQPVVGGWARYRLRGARDSTEMRLALVGTATWGGTAHVWQESLIPTPVGETVIQTLVPAHPYDPTTVRRAILKAPGRDPVEVPASALLAMRQHAQGAVGLDACRTGLAVAWETLEVPAGRLRAMHVRYARDGRTAEVWLAPAVPFALVRSLVASPGDADPIELVLIGHGRDAVPTVPLPAGPPR